MIDAKYIQCNFCKTKISLRFQMGHFNIPFDICCPECGVHIYGFREIEKGNVFSINNAQEIDCNIDDINYYSDFSIELPHRKVQRFISIDKLIDDGFSPFMSMVGMFDGDSYFKLLQRMLNLLHFREHKWTDTLPLYDLYFNKKVELTADSLLKFNSGYVIKNELDAMMALHQITVLGLNSILPTGSLGCFSNYATQIFKTLKFSDVNLLIQCVGHKEYFESVSKRLIKIYSRWIKEFEKYIPVVMLSLGHIFDKLDKEAYGIATTSFDDMKSFYADSYELILEMVDIAVGLNNMVVRGNYNNFSPEAGAKDFETYKKQAKSERIKSLIESEPFSQSIKMDRHVRNAIAHYNYEFDPITQKIKFIDKFKDNKNTVEMYLVDLAVLCYENIVILVYLDELLYSLRKIDYIKDGMVPNIKFIRNDGQKG